MTWFSASLYIVVIACAVRWAWYGAIGSAVVSTAVLWLFVLARGATLNDWFDVPLLFGCGALVAALGGKSRIEQLAFRDVPTGLPNGAWLHEKLGDETRRAVRDRVSPALLVIGIDGWARLETADARAEIMSAVAAMIRNAIRAVDLAARLREDEFAVVLPETDSAGARLVAERIRRAIENYAVHVTASIGVVEIETTAWRTPDEYLHRADQAMFEARRIGGNRVMFYDAEMHGA